MGSESAVAVGGSERAAVPARLDVVESVVTPTELEGLVQQMRSVRTATLSWDGGGLDVGVYLSHAGADERLIARGRAGSRSLDWIRANVRYEFRLYGGEPDGSPLAEKVVKLPALPERERLELLRRTPAYADAVAAEREAVGRALSDPRRRERLAADAAAAEALGVVRGAPLLAELVRDHSLEFDRCLSLGCGTGELERRLLAEGIGRRFDGIDLVPAAVDEACRKAIEEGLDIQYSVGDLNTIELEPARYDLVVADGSLSRVLALEHVVDQVWRTLKPSGFLWIHDYVGERRSQHRPERLAIANAALQRLPSRLRWNAVDSRQIESVVSPRPDELGPFDAHRSDELRRPLWERFGRVRMDEYDAVLQLVCPVGTRAAFLRDDAGREALDDLLALDRLLIRTGALTATRASILLSKSLTRDMDLDGIAGRLEKLAVAATPRPFRAELNACVNDLRVRLPGFDTLPPAKQEAVVDLAFGLGPEELALLDDLTEALGERDWLRARAELERLPWLDRSGPRGTAVRELLARDSSHLVREPSGVEVLPPAVPAGVYRPVEDLCVISSFFNPSGYETKALNIEAFLQPIERGGLGWSLIECAFGSDPFVLPPGPKVLHRRAASKLWQKERLLNLVVEQLPPTCTKVAWVDADVLFVNPDWAVEASALLEDYELVQPYEYIVRLPKGARRSLGSTRFRPTNGKFIGESRHWRSFAAAHVEAGGDFRSAYGHPGFAWAARRELLERRTIYDRCISGGGDKFIAHAAIGDWCSSAATNVTGGVTPLLADASAWAEAWYADVGGRIAFVPGVLLHLWHGQLERRQYNLRGFELASLGFDPRTDLRVSDNGCWEWAGDKPELQEWAVRYFDRRQEDG